MNRRDFVALFGGISAMWPLGAAAQRAGHVVRIGVISTTFAPRTAAMHAFRERLKELGYIEGRNLAVEIRDGEGRNDRLPALAADLVRLPVDVIVTLGPYALEAARDATATIPIVFAGVGANFAPTRSGGNLTVSLKRSLSRPSSGWHCSRKRCLASPEWPSSRIRITMGRKRICSGAVNGRRRRA